MPIVAAALRSHRQKQAMALGQQGSRSALEAAPERNATRKETAKPGLVLSLKRVFVLP